VVTLSFDFLDIENAYNCKYDVLAITSDGEEHNLCGEDMQPDDISATSPIFIRFHTDYSVKREGFSLQYSRT